MECLELGVLGVPGVFGVNSFSFDTMNNREFGEYLETRTKRFANEIIRLSSTLPKSTESHVIRNQITKSGTSIGANYREAN